MFLLKAKNTSILKQYYKIVDIVRDRLQFCYNMFIQNETRPRQLITSFWAHFKTEGTSSINVHITSSCTRKTDPRNDI